MDRERVTKILQQLADKNNCTIEEIRFEIQLSMDEAQNSPDPNIRAAWASFPRAGDHLTPEDFIAFLYENMSDNNPW